MLTTRKKTEQSKIQASIGVEAELHKIHFIFIDPITQKVKSLNNAVLSIIEPTVNGVEVVNDVMTVSNFYPSLKKIAAEEKLAPLTKVHNKSYIFEFFTHPSKTPEHLERQFKEIVALETDLIRYLFHIKKTDPNRNLLCVKEWIDKSYNANPEHKEVKAGKESEKLFILIDFSIKQLIGKISISEGLVIDPKKIQSSLPHYLQFNFVTALGKKMGTKLVSIFNENSCLEKYKKEREDKIAKNELLKSKNLFDPEFEESLAETQRFIDRLKTKRKILRQAEKNAEKACNFIRSIQNIDRRLIKLEGFFFILAMRILTETTYISRGIGCPKSKYLFFLKTQLSDLIYCLSRKDRDLLNDIDEHWSLENKDKLLAYIAGSQWVLTKEYKYNNITDCIYTIEDVLKSALQWETIFSNACQWFQNASIKSFEVPIEPNHIRRSSPLRRILLEYRGSKYLTLSDALTEANNIQQKAVSFCMTTYLYKKELDDVKPENVTKVIMQSDRTNSELFHLIEHIRFYNPSLLIDFVLRYPNILGTIHFYNQTGDSEIVYPSENMDLNIQEGMSRILTFALNDSLEDLKDNLKEFLIDDNQYFIDEDNKIDYQLNQLDRLYYYTENSEELSEENKVKVKFILNDLYYDVLFSLCKLPINLYDMEYINFIASEFNLSKKSARANKLFHFLKAFYKEFPEDDTSPHSIINIKALRREAICLKLTEFKNFLEEQFQPLTITMTHSVTFPVSPTTKPSLTNNQTSELTQTFSDLSLNR